MKLMDEHKKKGLNPQTKEETKETNRDNIEKDGMLLDDEDLEKVSGGGEFYQAPPIPM